MRFGDFEIHTFVEQRFKLDGGSMFGVIPKKLWSRQAPADENNLVDMVTNLFVLKAHGKVILFDAGLGDTLGKREKTIYGTSGVSLMDEGLVSLGLAPDDIDCVILSHLHTDHAGGAVRLEGNTFVPRFPNAEYIASRTEYGQAVAPNERTTAVYVPERYQALKDSGRLKLIGSLQESTGTRIELLEGIQAVFTGGHTPGHFALEVESEGRKLFYYADIFCTSAHMPVAWVAATDLAPLETMEIKRRKLDQIIDEQVIMAFDHDVNIPLGVVKREGKRLVVENADVEIVA